MNRCLPTVYGRLIPLIVGDNRTRGPHMLGTQLPDRKMKVTVLGAGSWGTTVATLAARNNDATLWGRDEAHMR